jgi:hypothetical protein
MRRKSKRCFSEYSGKALTVYDSELEALDGADYVNEQYHNNLTPYRCEACKLWHLSPAERHTPSVTCQSCFEHSGHHKDLYHTKDAAKQRAKIIYAEQEISLKVYKCPHHEGWHLTKS